MSSTPCVTSGTQKWNGAEPSLVIRAINATFDATGLVIFIIDHCPEYIRLIVKAIISIMDAVAWVIKYFVAASVDRGLVVFIRIGIIVSMFISSPIQAVSQWELIIVISVPASSVVRIRLRASGFISMGGV